MQERTLTIHVDNLTEDVHPFVSTLIDNKRIFEIDENSGLADRCLYYYCGVENLLLLVPKSINVDFLKYFERLFPKQYLEALRPVNETGETSIDVMHDDAIMRALDTIVPNFDEVHVRSYSSTAQFYELLRLLQERYPAITADETPDQRNYWTVDCFGSKAGLRDRRFSVDGEELLPMCEGEMVFGLPKIVQTAADYYQKYDGIVIKTNKGHAGMGVVIIRKGSLSGSESIEDQIQAMLPEGYWNIFPSVIEEYVPYDLQVGGGFPNAECFIDKNGKLTYLYSCGMRVTSEGQFKGVEIGRDVLPDGVETELRTFGDRLGKLFAESGYVGYFDIDCIYGIDGKLYLSESNVRKTGGTHVYHMAKQLFGENFADQTYAISNNTYQIEGDARPDFNQLHDRLQSILFDEVTKEGLFIVAANLLHRGVFGYVIFGKDKVRANEVERKMEQLLAELPTQKE